MILQRIKVKSFKSFGEFDIELTRLNVLIGSNASGKSNFISILKFIRDILNHGLENALSMQGGAEFISNYILDNNYCEFLFEFLDTRNQRIKFEFDLDLEELENNENYLDTFNEKFYNTDSSAIEYMKKCAIYDFNPTIPKMATSLFGKADLEENGSNLSIVLRKLLRNEEQKRSFLNLLKNVLPFVSNIKVERYLDRYLNILINEKYVDGRDIPSYFLSDGTVFIIDMIISLYFEDKPMAVFEEAGRRIHPHMISKMIDMMREVSEEKQIIVSTHNPEIVKYAGAENVILVSRDQNGCSTLSRPSDKEEIKKFMANEIGIEELFVQNLLK
jgi:predicted ATPase